MPKISVITAVLNGEKHIRETVESVLSQKGDFDLEYIVRDGKSIDRTLEILREYEDRCVVISEKDGSPQQAINSGMEMATGDICCWLNADDCFNPGTLERVANVFEGHPDRLWCYGYCSIIDGNGREIRKPITWYKSILGYFFSRNMLLCENYINQPSTFWKRELWEMAGYLENEYKAAFDYHQWIKMAGLSKAIPIHTRLARFRRHPGSISENHFERQFDEEMSIVRQYGNFMHVFIHTLNRYKIVFIYKLLRLLNG